MEGKLSCANQNAFQSTKNAVEKVEANIWNRADWLKWLNPKELIGTNYSILGCPNYSTCSIDDYIFEGTQIIVKQKVPLIII